MKKRKHGISVLIACQNEEAIIELCIRSFLEFGDEIIVVDNGSEDHSIEIITQLAKMYPEKIQFFNKPEINTLFENRQYAFEKSKYNWVFRCDSDYVAYTSGEYDIKHFREYLLSQKKTIIPTIVSVPQYNLVLDFYHTGIEGTPGVDIPAVGKKYYQLPKQPFQSRFYRVFPFFKFKRLGKWEGVRLQKYLPQVYYDKPLWVQCSVKSNLHFFMRSRRSVWRDVGDYKRYPTLKSYIDSIIEKEFGTKDWQEAAEIHMQKEFYPYMQLQDSSKHFPIPELILKARKSNPVWEYDHITYTRKYLGVRLPNGDYINE